MNQTSHDHALSVGPCTGHEFELIELHAGELESERSLTLQRHMEHCSRCRAYLTALDQLDLALAQALPDAAPSPEFDARLQARIAELNLMPTRAAALAAAERDHELMLRRLGRGLGWSAALNALALAPVVLGIIVACYVVAPQLLAELGATTPGASPVRETSLALGLLFAAFGLLYARATGAGRPTMPG